MTTNTELTFLGALSSFIQKATIYGKLKAQQIQLPVASLAPNEDAFKIWRSPHTDFVSVRCLPDQRIPNEWTCCFPCPMFTYQPECVNLPEQWGWPLSPQVHVPLAKRSLCCANYFPPHVLSRQTIGTIGSFSEASVACQWITCCECFGDCAYCSIKPQW